MLRCCFIVLKKVFFKGLLFILWFTFKHHNRRKKIKNYINKIVHNKTRLLHFILHISKKRFRKTNCSFLLSHNKQFDTILFSTLYTEQYCVSKRACLLVFIIWKVNVYYSNLLGPNLSLPMRIYFNICKTQSEILYCL
jgi:hypothetical protein